MKKLFTGAYGFPRGSTYGLKFSGSEMRRRTGDLQAGVSVDFAQIQATRTETPPTPSAASLERPETPADGVTGVLPEFDRIYATSAESPMGSILATPSWAQTLKLPHIKKFSAALALLLTSGLFCPLSALSQTINLAVNASVTFQTVGGVGTNINSWSWKNGELQPAIDILIDDLGYSIFRVVHDRICWVSCSSLTRPSATLAALKNLDSATLQAVYETNDMQDFWNTIAYLNSKGVRGEQIIINFMGWTPVWMGGSGRYGVVSAIQNRYNDDFGIMIASLVYYARTVRQLDFSLVAPMNEPDWNGLEGPQVTNTTQYANILAAIVTNMRDMGIYDVNVVGPDTAASNATNYISDMLANPTVAASVDHFTSHSYSSSPISYRDYSPRNNWVTETSKWCSGCDNNQSPGESEWTFGRDTADLLMGDIGNGYAATLNWEGFDTFYYHHDSYSAWGSVGCLQTGGGCTTSDTYPRTYFIRDRAYPQGTMALAIRPGMIKRGLTTSLSNIQALAFYDEASGGFSIVGHNKGLSAATINGQLQNIPTSISSLSSYQTGPSVHIQPVSAVPVNGGLFTVIIPGDTFFSLTNFGSIPDTTPPSAPINLAAAVVWQSGINLSWVASTDNVGVVGYRTERCQGAGCTAFAQIGTASSTSYSDSGLTSGATYVYRVRAADFAGNLSGYSATATATTPAPDTTPPSVPTGLTATAVSQSGINLNWTASTDNIGVAGYRIERCRDAGCTFVEIATSSIASYNDSALSTGGTYFYRVRATDAAGNLSSYSASASAILSATSLAIHPSTPAAVKANTATITTASFTPPAGSVLYVMLASQQAIISMTDDRASHLAYARQATYGNSGGGDAMVYLYTAPVTSSQAMKISVTQTVGGQYAMLKVLVVTGANTANPVGAKGGGRGVTGVVTDTYTSTGGGSWGWLLYADWTAGAIPTPGPDQTLHDSYTVSGEDTYAIIQRNATTPAAGTSVTLSTSAPTSGRRIAHLYFEMVKSATATTPAPDTTPPSVPTGLTATAVSQSGINLNWTASTDNIGVAGYRIERCRDAGCTFVEIATSSISSYNDSALSTGGTYFYRVRATDAAGNLSSYSASASAILSATSLAIHPSTPAAVKANTATITTASFTPPAGSVLYVMLASQQAIISMTDDRASHLAYARQATYGNSGGGDAMVYLYTAPVTSSQAMKISVTQTVGGQYAMLKVLVVTGANAANPVGAKGGGRGVTGVVTDTYTSTGGGSWGWLLYADWTAGAIPTPGPDQTLHDSYTVSGEDTYAIIQRNATTPAAGTSVTLSTSAPTSGRRIAHLYFEMVK